MLEAERRVVSGSTVGRLRKDARAIFDAAVRAVDAAACVRTFVALEGDMLVVGDARYDLRTFDRVVAVGAGKATPRMAVALEGILGDRLAGGAINTKYGHTEPLRRIRTTECGHPVPDELGVAGTREILALLEGADDRTLVIVLLSGGGSALLPAPAAGITLSDKQQTTRLLLGCGANIVELNVIRKHLSAAKGGGLARVAFPATMVALILSDVIGDPLDVIASGPTVPDPTTWQDCADILDRYRLLDQLPRTVRRRLGRGLAGEVADTPKPDDAALSRVHTLVVGSNRLAVAAAQRAAAAAGYATLVLSTRVEGEAREIAYVYSAIAKEILVTGTPLGCPACVIAGGETTVTVRGDGRGGRNQELALAVATQIGGWTPIVFLSGGTDGTDGPTDAAGALCDGETLSRAEATGRSANAFLRNNDAYHFFEPLGDLVMTGPTGTNVADLALLLVGDAGRP